MAAAPKYKVYDAAGTYQAACKEPEGAAVLASFYGAGCTVRLEHRVVVWTEGVDGHAAESYDAVAMLIYGREEYRRRAAVDRRNGHARAGDTHTGDER